MTFNCQRSKQNQEGLKDPPDRLSGDFRIHRHEKMFAGGEGKKKYSARQCKECATHK
jgi:hypothetical protein